MLSGKRTELGDPVLLRLLAAHPLLTLKVTAAIHWHALRLLAKRIWRPQPALNLLQSWQSRDSPCERTDEAMSRPDAEQHFRMPEEALARRWYRPVALVPASRARAGCASAT